MPREQEVMISAKLYQCREQSIYLRGKDVFRDDVAKFRPVFEQVMHDQDCNAVQALTELLTRCKGYENEGLLSHLLCAVGCELAEPTISK